MNRPSLFPASTLVFCGDLPAMSYLHLVFCKKRRHRWAALTHQAVSLTSQQLRVSAHFRAVSQLHTQLTGLITHPGVTKEQVCVGSFLYI